MLVSREGLEGDLLVGGHLGHSNHRMIELNLAKVARNNKKLFFFFFHIYVNSRRKSRESMGALQNEKGALVSGH